MSRRVNCWLALVLPGLLFLVGVAPAAAQGTEQERRACAPEVMRLCREYIPEVRLITNCLITKRAELNPECKVVMTTQREKVAAKSRPAKARIAKPSAPAKARVAELAVPAKARVAKSSAPAKARVAEPSVPAKARVAKSAKAKKKMASAAPSAPLLAMPVSLEPPASVPHKKAVKRIKKQTPALQQSSAKPEPAKPVAAKAAKKTASQKQQ
jgi:hypothetical protein